MATVQATLTAAHWLDALVGAVCDLAETTLGWPAASPDGSGVDLPATGEGAYVPMLTDDSAVNLGLVASPGGAQLITKAFLGLGDDEPDLPSEDVADAVGEVVNILAGTVKSRLITADATIRLGLPVYLAGHLQPTSTFDVAARRVAIGPVRATALAFHHGT